MNNTPRVLNRILIGILGIKLLAIGVLLMLLASVPAVGVWWHEWAGGVLKYWLDLFERTQFPRHQGSWLWFAICGGLVLVLALMVAWVAQQGKGRTSLIAAEEDPGGVPGNVGISGGVAEQALRAALADRPDLAGVTVAAYEIRGEPALKIRVEPRQGVAPHALAAEVSALVEALDAVIGKRTPVLIHIGSGTRSRFGRAERVR
ncbi:hypothetical protein [Arthrobacter sp. H-02-3]|uniref:hypothetical protein n=1 Tax=Arthrobacter sp. H-02-3 TaxID=2703675 RepID=UPI000DD2ACBD|nr:hypothetical protein [Arthrobacter sp. H-02-3]PVZ60364.1 hypothetical protein C9424_03675 [Arthrobacter sp. H-02-3]